MSSSPPATNSPVISSDALAAAAERRTQQNPPQLSAAQLAAEHEKRQKFRRLIDPGITRPNSKERALSSLKTLLTISQNLLREPENPKFQQFKPTNAIIKRELIDRKGALEFAVELGFHPEVKNFQPYYTFHKHHLHDLEIGAVVLKEYIDQETEKEERAERSRKNEKAAKDAAAQKVKLAYMDDRKSKMIRDEMERQQRIARAAAGASHASASTPRLASLSPTREMPGSGHVLNPSVAEMADAESSPDEVHSLVE